MAESKTYTVVVLGAGAFGTALAEVAAWKGHTVLLWARSEEQVETMIKTRRNPKHLQEYELTEGITPTHDLAGALAQAEIIISSLPTQRVPAFVREHKDLFPVGVPFVSSSKGIVLEEKKVLSAIVPGILENKNPYVALSGPSFAKEIMKKCPTLAVLAGEDEEVVRKIQYALSSEFFRFYHSTDVLGVELGGALKNPLSIGAGIIEGLGHGINTLAGFVTRGTSELVRIATKMGAKPETVTGLSGIGDLMLTAFGGLSRNKKFGLRISQGEKPEDIINSMTEVVEGLPTLEITYEICKEHNIDAPIIMTIYRAVKGIITVEECQRELMLSGLRAEHESA